MQSDAWRTFRERSQWEPVQYSVRQPNGESFNYQSFARTAAFLGRLEHGPRIAGIGLGNVDAFTDHVRSRSDWESVAFKLELFQPRDAALEEALTKRGWIRSRASQYRFAVDVSLDGDWEDLFARVKSRARNEARVGWRAEVRVEHVPLSQQNIQTMLGLIAATKKRSSAFFRNESYLTNSWHIFASCGQGELWFASIGGDVVAGAFVLTYGAMAWYKDGGSIRGHEHTFAARVLHFEIMRNLQERGFQSYELGNIPPPESAQHSSMKGLYIFKTAYAKETIEFMPAFEYPLSRRFTLWHSNEDRFLRAYSAISKNYWY